jgi:hypothetical protein
MTLHLVEIHKNLTRFSLYSVKFFTEYCVIAYFFQNLLPFRMMIWSAQFSDAPMRAELEPQFELC